MKIGMYTEDEIFNYMTSCEGSMLGRSMYDAIFDKIHALITKNAQLKKELQEYKENYECILKQRDDITKNATEQIESLIDEKNKYKSLYKNEKEHTDTLKRIIEKIEEYIEVNTEYKESTFYGLPDFYVFKGNIEKLLDLLKEIR